MKKEICSSSRIYPVQDYSHAVRTGPFVWTSGIIALDTDGQIVGRGDICAQIEQVYKNMQEVLGAYGVDLNGVVKITMFATNILFRPVIMEARAKYFPSNPPASSFFVVSALSTADLLFEMEAVALINDTAHRVSCD